MVVGFTTAYAISADPFSCGGNYSLNLIVIKTNINFNEETS
jgi:hypothetical protein